jgi:ATP-binding cassette subfamily C protein
VLLESGGRRAIVSIALAASAGLTTGVSLLLIVPLLQLVGLEIGDGSLDRIARLFRAGFDELHVRPTLTVVLTLYVVVNIVQAGITYRLNTLNGALEYDVAAALRRRLFDGMAGTSWAFFSRTRPSDFTHILTTEVERVASCTYHLTSLVTTGLVAMVYFGFALRLSAPLTAAVVGVGLAAAVPVRRRRQLVREAGEAVSEAFRRLHASIAEFTGAMKIARSYGADERHTQSFAALARQVRQAHVSANRHYFMTVAWFEVGAVTILAGVVGVGVTAAAFSSSELLLLLFLFSRIVPQLSTLEQHVQRLVAISPSFLAILDLEARCRHAAEPRPGSLRPLALEHQLRLDRVSYAYDDALVLRDVSLIVRAGSITALVGPSGCGKTTAADLVMGLLTPASGRVLIDGKALDAELGASWRHRIGYVAQDGFFLHDTIRANLLWAAPRATEADIHRALRLAAADEFVDRLPRGLETGMGERGQLFSVGQRQRVALARALLRDPALLLLDEATSSLDAESEARILETVEGLRGRMTILLITHRLASIRTADVIHVMEHGRIVESGSWAELMTARGRLRHQAGRQGLAAAFESENHGSHAAWSFS